MILLSTPPDLTTKNRAKRRGERGRAKKRKQKWLRALRLGVNTIQLRRSVRINYPPKLENFERVEKTQDKNMIPPKESGKDLMLSQSGRVVLCSCHVSFWSDGLFRCGFHDFQKCLAFIQELIGPTWRCEPWEPCDVHLLYNHQRA